MTDGIVATVSALGGGTQWSCSNHMIHHDKKVELLWCDHLQSFFMAGEDAQEYSPGDSVIVPLIPTQELYVAVKLEDTDEFGGACPMQLVYTTDFGRTKTVRLGFWNPGEGIMVMRDVIVDFIRSQVSSAENWKSGEPMYTKCPNRAHSLRSSRAIAANAGDPAWRWKCLWNIVMEGACTACIDEANGVADENFGVDDSVLPGRPRWK